MKTTSRTTSSQQMHTIVWTLLGVFTLMVMTFPIAMFRVSQKEQFSGFHVKSLTHEGQGEKPANGPSK